VKATRRSAVTASGLAALGLSACTTDQPSRPSDAGSGSTSGATATVTPSAAADPDRAALDEAIALTSSLIAGLAGADPGIDPGGRLAAIHQAHLTALQDAAGSTTPSPAPSGGKLSPARLRRRELNAQRELARLALAAESGALARVFASMSAGIAAGLSHRGEVPR
jgi:hypothetical protein